MYPEESNVVSYGPAFPRQFKSARGSVLEANSGETFLDFLSGCGSMNYGHNHPVLRDALLRYIEESGVVMSMDLATDAKERFIHAFVTHILCPRSLDYKLQFTGPTGANAVEAAIKLARKVTGRTNVIAFTNGFHGCSLGALSLTGNKTQRQASQALLNQVTRAPYDGYFGPHVDTAEQLQTLLKDPSSGVDAPAAFVVEVIQGEGGLNAATSLWLSRIATLAKSCGALLIVDDIQAGCGRSGTFFSFERAGIEPDLVVMAKGISGFGLPMSMVLLKGSLDAWGAGEHNGTFRGNNYAFVTAEKALTTFWQDDAFATALDRKVSHLTQRLKTIAARHGFATKGRGFMQGIDLLDGTLASDVSKQCFQNGLIIETCGPNDEVLKLLPPLTIDLADLGTGLAIIDDALSAAALADHRHSVAV